MDEPVGARAHAGPSRGQRLLAQLAERRRRYRARGVLFKVAWILAGVLVTIAGVAMLALPGPAFVVIPAGLAMLALQFDWAERLLIATVAKADEATAKARNASPAQRALTLVLGLVAAVAALAAVLLWDIPFLPV